MYYKRPYCSDCKLIWEESAIGRVAQCSKCGAPLILKNFNPYTKSILGLLVISVGCITFFIKEVPILWIGGFLWGLSIIVNAFRNWAKVKALDKNFQGNYFHSFFQPIKSFLKSTDRNHIVICSNCGRRNRVHKQHGQVSFRCGACKTNLPNPFAQRSFLSKRFITIGLFAILALVVVIFISLPSKNTPQSLLRDQKNQQKQSLPSQYTRPPLPPYDEYRIIQPKAPLPPPRRLSNGTVITGLSRKGNGTLTVDNGTGHDAVIKLVYKQEGRTIVEFYVCQKQTATVDGIPDGDFFVIYASGLDWDSTKQRFTREKSFAKFDRILGFITSKQTKGDEVYTQTIVFTLSLHRVFNGNATTTNVGEEEFLKY
jgi:ssDNA-binding Zn-finger/Zn-ribbon topoisomerase 1